MADIDGYIVVGWSCFCLGMAAGALIEAALRRREERRRNRG